MKDEIVSFEIATLARDKGFHDVISCIRGKNYYNLEGELNGDSSNELKEYLRWKKEGGELKEINISAPTQSLLQRWLREKHNTFVICTQEFYPDGINYLVQVFKYTPEKERCYEGTMLYGDNAEFETYELSLEFGLRLALELI
jgi:hypothetical protein